MGKDDISMPKVVIDVVKKDFVVVFMCLVAILICLYTLYMAKDYSDKCNDHWIEQWNEKCPNSKGYYNTFNDSFSLVPKETKGVEINAISD